MSATRRITHSLAPQSHGRSLSCSGLAGSGIADSQSTTADVAIVGAGPAGLTAAYLLTKAGKRVVVLEADPDYVGGISRTVSYKGYRFDIGGHRFFSKSQAVEQLWTELLGPELLDRPRLSRIYYREKFFDYPIRPLNVLRNLGVSESLRALASYAHARLRPVREPRNVEEWVTNQFGRRLYEIFFRTYTEKVWGMRCTEISNDWAAQRIKGLSLKTAIFNGVGGSRRQSTTIKTLTDRFRYPRLGPGMMWEAARDRVVAGGGNVLLGRKVVGLERTDHGWRVRACGPAGTETFPADHVIYSAPMQSLATMLEPPLPDTARTSAGALRYRDFIMIALMLPDRRPIPDNWIYIHDPSVRVGRIQVFKSWSQDMVPDPAMTCVGMEYFCFEGDGLWSSSDDELLALAGRELETLGLAARADVVDGHVVRQPKAYPVYDAEYVRHVQTVRDALASAYPGLHLVGRNGMHKYNNQDHAMMTAMLTADEIITGVHRDVWKVNVDAEYHEEASGERLTPRRVDQ